MPSGALGKFAHLGPSGAHRDQARPASGPVGRALAVAVLLACWDGAAAEVTLNTAVSKVETTLDSAGRVKRELMPADNVMPGEELRYSITFTNDSEMMVDAERVVITNPIPEGAGYVAGSAGGDFSRVEYSTDGETFSGNEPTAAPPGAGPVPQPAAADDAAEQARVQSLRWTYLRDLQPGEAGEVYFHVRMQ